MVPMRGLAGGPLVTMLLVLGALPAVTQAQDEKAVTNPPADSKTSPPPAMRATDLTFGLGYHGPARLTASATAMWGTARMFGALAPGKLAQVRVGAGGGQVALGFVAGAFEDSFFRPSGVGVSLKAILLRTWRDPARGASGNSYVGFESDVILLGIRGSAGYAWKVGGAGKPGGRFVWSLGLGL